MARGRAGRRARHRGAKSALRRAAASLSCGALARQARCWSSLAIGADRRSLPDERFAGLQWTFARIKYNSYAGDARTNLRVGYWEEPWAIDAPAAEQNLTRRIRSVTVHRGHRSGRHHAGRREDLAISLGLYRRAQQPDPEREGSRDAARIPAARRHAHARRFPRSVRVGPDGASAAS